MGGIGKTELALQYAIAQFAQEQYLGGFCWLRARDQEIATQIVTFAQTKLGLTLPDGLDEKGQVDYCWGHWREGDVLVVLDDVTEFDAIEPYLPPSDPKFKVLLTTRLNLGGFVQSLSIEELDDESALTLLETLVGPERIQSQLEDAKTLYGWVGNLPLGLELLGRFLARKLDWSLKKLIERLESKKLEAKALIGAESGMTAQLGVAAALELSWVELNGAEQELARLLGIFSAAPISWHLIEMCLPEQDKDNLEDIRDRLIANSLLKRVGQGNYQLHQIVQEFFRVKLKKCFENGQSLIGVFCRNLALVAKKIEQIPTKQRLEEVRTTIPHLEEVINQWIDFLNDDDFIYPFLGTYRFYEAQGNYKLALIWQQNSLEQAKKRFGDEHPIVATNLNNLAAFYDNQGRYEKAEEFYLKALKMSKDLLGNEHTGVAHTLNNLAYLYTKQRRYEEAEPLCIQSLKMRQKFLGYENHRVSDSLTNLGEIYYKQERYEEAEHLFIEALQMRQKLLGKEDPRVADSLNNLACLYSTLERYEEAEILYIQSLQMNTELLCEGHPKISLLLNNLADLFCKQGKCKEAEQLFLQALEMRKKRFGEEHLDFVFSINNLAAFYRMQERYEEAEPLYVQALEIYQKLLGNEHPNVAIIMWCLGTLYQKQGKNDEAESLYRNALSIFQEKLGPDHPHTH